MLGPAWASLGLDWAILGRLRVLLGSWGHIGRLGAILGSYWVHRGIILAIFGSPWLSWGAILGHRGAILEPCWGYREPCRGEVEKH
jgi:hypothetical protein